MGTLYDVEGFNVVHTTLDDELSNVRSEHKAEVGTKLVAAFGCFSIIIEQVHVDQMASLQVKPTTMMKPGGTLLFLRISSRPSRSKSVRRSFTMKSVTW